MSNKTIIVFSGEFDKVVAAFVIANGAAAMDDEVTMFFTFWGLNALRKPEKVSGQGQDGAAEGVRRDDAARTGAAGNVAHELRRGGPEADEQGHAGPGRHEPAGR